MRLLWQRALLVGAVLWLSLVALAVAQTQPKLEIAVDTAGISRIGDSVYTTWVFSRANAHSYPSSGIIVEFDCKTSKVRRTAQVKYELKADSTGVWGPLVEVNGPWVPVTIPRLFNLVCTIGPTHNDHTNDPEPFYPDGPPTDSTPERPIPVPLRWSV